MEMIDWDQVYRVGHTPGWNIGRPQPEYERLINQEGIVKGEVLDAGCGYAELSLALAARGHSVVGVDIAAAPIASAILTAAMRRLPSAKFIHADIMNLKRYANRFSTIFDSGLLDVVPPKLHATYLRSILHMARADARLYILAFASGAFPGHTGTLPTQFTRDSLHQLVSAHWNIHSIRPAVIHARNAQLPDGSVAPDIVLDADRAVRLPAYLVIARKPVTENGGKFSGFQALIDRGTNGRMRRGQG